MTSFTPRRLFAAVIAVALIVSVQPAWASHITARDTADACADAPEDGFTDAGTEGSRQEEAIDCIAWYDITVGKTARTYVPADAISRAQMASMVARMMRASETTFEEPNSSEDFFTDDEGSRHEDNINFLAKHEVIQGTGGTNYSPDNPVTRAQMATFLVNAMDAIGAATPAGSQDYFEDDEGSRHEANINTLAELAIVEGRAGDRYDPDLPVTRGNMAFFISRTLDYLVDEGLLVPPEAEQPPAEGLSVTLDDDTVEQGGQITGDITHPDKTISSVVLNGCGFFNEPVQDRNTSEAGIQFEETLSSNQQPGSCTLTFTANYSDGTSESESVQITIVEATSPEATNGTHSGVSVQSVNYSNNRFIGDDEAHEPEAFDYDSNDTYQWDGTTLTEDGMAKFEGMLTAQDVLDVNYNNNPDATSTFNMTTDFVPPPTNASAAAGDFDNDGTRDDVLVSWARSEQPDAIYDVYRDESAVTDNETFGPEDGNPVASDVDGTSVTLMNQPTDDDLVYFVVAKSPTSESESEEATTNAITVPAPAPAAEGPPESEVARHTGSTTTVSDGDVWEIAFSDSLAGLQAGDSIRVVDDDGDAATVSHADNATFVLASRNVNGKAYGTNQVLDVILHEDLFDGADAVDYPVEITTSTGLTDNDGNPPNWTGSDDREITDDVTAPQSDSVQAEDTDSDGVISSGDEIAIDFNEDMNPSPSEPVADSVTIRDAAGDSVTLTHGSNATFSYGSGSVAMPDDSLLTITVGGSDTNVNYGSGTLVRGAVFVTDVEGWNWNFAGSPDRAVDTAPPDPDEDSPSIVSAAGAANGTSPDTITLTYDEPVRCTENQATAQQFTYDPTPTDPPSPDAGEPNNSGDEHQAIDIDCNNTTTVVLTFQDGTFQAGTTGSTLNSGDTVSYVDDGSATTEVEDLADNPATTPDTVEVTG